MSILNELVPSRKERVVAAVKKRKQGPPSRTSATGQRGPGRPAILEPRSVQLKGATTPRRKEMVDRWILETFFDTTSNVVEDILIEAAEADGYKPIPFADGDETKLQKRIDASYDKMDTQRKKLKDQGEWQPEAEEE